MYNKSMKNTRMSKVQLIGATNTLVAEYLGFSSPVNGTNWSVNRLEVRFNAYCTMVELARKSREICNRYTAEERLAIALGGTIDAKPNGAIDMAEAQRCSQEANAIWLGRF